MSNMSEAGKRGVLLQSRLLQAELGRSVFRPKSTRSRRMILERMAQGEIGRSSADNYFSQHIRLSTRARTVCYPIS